MTGVVYTRVWEADELWHDPPRKVRRLCYRNAIVVADGTYVIGLEQCLPLDECTAEQRTIAEQLPVVTDDDIRGELASQESQK